MTWGNRSRRPVGRRYEAGCECTAGQGSSRHGCGRRVRATLGPQVDRGSPGLGLERRRAGWQQRHDRRSKPRTLTGVMQPGSATVSTTTSSSTTTTTQSVPTVISSPTFPQATPIATALSVLAGEGIVSGFEDGTFVLTPASPAAVREVVVKTLDYPVTGNEVCPFTDVQAQIGADPSTRRSTWPRALIAASRRAKRPPPSRLADSITREQLITMITRHRHPAGYQPGFTAAQFSLRALPECAQGRVRRAARTRA